ncbi:N-acetylglucosamine-6-phosphate deacetylase [uncultured Roseibium sp.]|uniref:N-acetylglucosamine-6-phosphate deacetylase n=1 Tax=uncultured Roseibium sp. TaxID=1936171 RepID=UPI00260484AC|nr:N-acetylglucosamine-6-phosphate deacetylase [uncultured Roseibium sp.]
MTGLSAYTCSRIFDGDNFHKDAALLVEGGRVKAIVPLGALPADQVRTDLGNSTLVPGFVDLQVNGGGGLMLGDVDCVEDIARICHAHLQLGTTSLTPTLITDSPEVTRRVLKLGIEAWAEGVRGFHGLHLEGPHLYAGRKGAHDASLIRPIEDEDMDLYLYAASQLPSLMITVAPETVSPEQISRLAGAGIHVSLGHSGASYKECSTAAEAGAACVTHLFNAMSPLQHREPGLVGAALDLGSLSAGLIADGVHVDPAAIRIALEAKSGPGRIFLVTDAMSQTGTDVTSFHLGGREIFRQDGRLTLSDGTLAGADIDLPTSVAYLVESVGVDIETALSMATSFPADIVGRPLGRLKVGCQADFVCLDDDFKIVGVWLSGHALGE